MNTPTPSCFELSCTECDARTAALTAERDQLRADLERADALYQRACEVEHELRAEVKRFKAALEDPQKLHAHCLRTLNEGQIAHLFGERVTEIVNRAERAEADLAAERVRLDWLLLDNLTRFDDSISHRTAIDAAMQEGAK